MQQNIDFPATFNELTDERKPLAVWVYRPWAPQIQQQQQPMHCLRVE